jgi:hypothetical protein
MQVRPMLAQIDRDSGYVKWAEQVRLLLPGTDSTGLVASYQDLIFDNGTLVALQGAPRTFDPIDSTDFSIQFFDLNGNLLRSKGYSFGDSTRRAQATDIVPVEDGYILYGSSNLPSYGYLLKINKSGDLLWLRRLVTSTGISKPERIAVQGDDIYMTGASDPLYADIFALKTDKDGQVDAACGAYFEDIPADDHEVPITLAQTAVNVTPLVRFAVTRVLTSTSTPLQSKSLCVTCSPPPCFDVNTAQTIRFCPDELVEIGGVQYGLPGIVRDTIDLPNGCDSIIVYTLEYEPSPVPLLFSLTCPANIAVSVPSGSNTAMVTYSNAVLTSNCPCPNKDVSLWQGLPSGSSFPIGSSTVAYVGSDDCGNTGTCSFTVQVAAEKPCDTKIAGCIKYELLRVDTSSTGFTYSVRVTNNCTGEMDYSRFQLAGGLALDMPDDSEYTAPSGRKYRIRNPHFSHVRFKTTGQGIKNGESDVFVYKLPPSANIAFINVGTKLRTGEQFESLLINFGCEPSSGSSAQRSGQATAQAASVAPPSLHLSPNPANDRVRVQFQTKLEYTLRVFRTDGQMLLQTSVQTPDFQLILSDQWPAGVYLIDCTDDAGRRATARLVRM